MFLTFPTPPDTAWAFRQPYHEIPCVAVSLGHPCLNTRVVLGALNFGDFERLKLVGDVDSCIAWIGRPEDREAQQARAWRRLTKKFRGEDLLEGAAKTGWRVDAWFSRSPEPGANAAVFGEEAGVALPPPLDEILGEPRDVFFRVVAERREVFEKAKKAKEAKKIKAKASDRPSRTARRAAKKKKVSEETKDGDESEALFVVNEEVTAATQENVPVAGRNRDLNDVVMCPVAEAEQQVGGIDPAASSPYVFFERELDALIKESSDQAFPDVKFEDFPLPQDIPLLVDTTCEPRPSPAVTGNPFTDWKKPDVFLPGENKAFDDGFARLLGNFNDLGRNISAHETAAPGQQAPSRNPFLSSRQHAPHPSPFIPSGQQRPLPNPFDSPSPFDSPVEQTRNRNPFFSSGQQAPHPNPFDFSSQHVPDPNPFVSSGQQTPHPNPSVSSGPRAPYPNPFVSSSPRGPPPATTSKKPIMGHFATKLQAPLGLVGQGSPPETEKPLVYKKVRPATPAGEPIHGARSLTSTSSTIIQNTPGSDEDTDVIRETPRKSTKRSKGKGKGPKTPAASGNKKAATGANPFSDEHEIYDATPPKEAAPSQQPNNAEEKDAKQLTKEQRKEKAARRKQRRQAQKAEEEEKKRLLDEIKAAEIQKREAREKQERDEKTREIIERMHQKFEDDRKRQAEEEAEEARRLQEAIEEEERRKAAEEQRAIAEADAKKRQAELQQAVAEQKRLRAQAAAEKQRATDEDEAKKKQADLAAAEEKRLLEQAAAEKQRLDEQVAAEKQRLADQAAAETQRLHEQAAAEKKQEEERRQAAAAEEERLAQQAQQQAAAEEQRLREEAEAPATEEQQAREAAARKAKRSLEKAAEEEKRLAAVKAANEKKKLLRKEKQAEAKEKKKQRLAADRVAAEERRRHEEAERALGDLPRKGVGHPKKIEPALEEKIWNLDDSEPECADLGQEACAVDLDRGEATAHGDAIDCGDAAAHAAAHAAARTPAHAAAIDAGDATDAGDSANHGDAIGIDVAMDANNAIDLGDVVGVDEALGVNEACLEVTAPSNGPGVVSAVDMTAYYAEENAFVVDQILRYGFWNPEWRYNKSHRGRGRSKSVPDMAPQGPGRQDGSVASEV